MKNVACTATVAACVFAGLMAGNSAHAQFGNFGLRGGVVGGVSVDASGAVRAASVAETTGLLQDLKKAVSKSSEGMATKTGLRMISLKGLQQKIDDAIAAGESLPAEVLYLAGLQRVEYVLAYPEQNDIVLAGPAEAWRVREDATVVGETTGRPVLQLEDLITAMRTVTAAQQQPISVSIDPTPEGELNLQRFLSQLQIGPGFNPAMVEPAMRQAFGPQQVTLTAVAKDSRMASVLVAADYRMKRLAMNLEESPVAGLPSYMEMIRDGGAPRGKQPRWWIACDYDAILHSEDNLAWKLDGLGIKAMAEDQYVDANGQRNGTGKVNKKARQWADSFTAKFDELCQHNAAFGDLRNAMDLNIVATIIQGHDLETVVGCDFGLLRGESGKLETPEWKSPKQIAPECSFVRGRAGWTVSASGGVEINPWRIISEDAKVDPQLKSIHVRAATATGETWWWN